MLNLNSIKSICAGGLGIGQAQDGLDVLIVDILGSYQRLGGLDDLGIGLKSTYGLECLDGGIITLAEFISLATLA